MAAINKTYSFLIEEIQKAAAAGDSEAVDFYTIILDEINND